MFDEIAAPRFHRKMPAFLSEQEMAHLLDHIEADNAAGARHGHPGAVIRGGSASQRVDGLNRDDLDQQRIVRVRGKGGKERLLPVGSAALAALQAYLARYEQLRRRIGR